MNLSSAQLSSRPLLRAATAKRRASLGLTLIEIMVVVAIIALLMGGIGVVAFNRFKDAQLTQARSQTVEIQHLVEQYMLMKRGKCPKNLQELKGAGIASKVSKDPWGNDYEIKCPGEKTSVDVTSYGPDGQSGTDDDINNFDDESEGAVAETKKAG